MAPDTRSPYSSNGKAQKQLHSLQLNERPLWELPVVFNLAHHDVLSASCNPLRVPVSSFSLPRPCRHCRALDVHDRVYLSITCTRHNEPTASVVNINVALELSDVGSELSAFILSVVGAALAASFVSIIFYNQVGWLFVVEMAIIMMMRVAPLLRCCVQRSM